MPTETKYSLAFSERTYTISDPDDETPGPYAHQGDYGLTVSMDSISLTPSNSWERTSVVESDCDFGFDDIKAGEYAHVVYAVYTTGGTFGSHGAWTVLAVVDSNEKAKAAEDEAVNGEGYRVWDGYFESLDHISIDILVMQP